MPFVITHWINLVAMILLIITGFSIHFPFWGGFMGIAAEFMCSWASCCSSTASSA